MATTPASEERREAQPGQTVLEFPFPHRDMRLKRPPLLSFVLRLETLRRAARVLSLVTLDVAGIFLAIYTALAFKALVRVGHFGWHDIYEQTKDIVVLATLVTLLLFAKSGLYADRGQRPGLPRVIGSLFQVTVVALLFAVINGNEFSSYYIFYGSLFFAILYISAFRYGYEKLTGVILRAAGYQRRAVLVGTGHHIEAVAHALADSPSTVEVVGFVSLVPRPDNGLRSLGGLDDLGEVIDEHRIDEVIIADPDFPQREAVELVDRAHRRGVRVRIAPSTMEILVHRAEFVPGETVPLFELKPPVFEGID